MTRIEMAQWIVDREARRDSAGNVKLYSLPPNDGGGRYEYAGINDRYHPTVLREIVMLVNVGKHQKAEQTAVAYLADYTDLAGSWSALPAVSLFLRDSAFNRGPAGAAKILQRAVRVPADGRVGPATRAALRTWEARPLVLLARLRTARERYELDVAGMRPNFWTGLENRWDAAFEASAHLV